MNTDKRHYEAIVKRGFITPKTTVKDFMDKHHEETHEMIMESINFNTGIKNNFIQETIDTIKTLENMLIHFGVDIEKEKEINTIYQENRND